MSPGTFFLSPIFVSFYSNFLFSLFPSFTLEITNITYRLMTLPHFILSAEFGSSCPPTLLTQTHILVYYLALHRFLSLHISTKMHGPVPCLISKSGTLSCVPPSLHPTTQALSSWVYGPKGFSASTPNHFLLWLLRWYPKPSPASGFFFVPFVPFSIHFQVLFKM